MGLAAPSSWMLDKMGGVFTIKPSSGPHKQGESLPIALFLRNRLKYALNMKEVETICKQRLIKIDGELRTDPRFPTGFMDVIQLEKTGENFRIIYDVKGRFIVHRITAAEAKYKLCRVREVKTGPKNVPFLYTNDGRTIRYPDPAVRVHDSVQVDIATGKIQDTLRFDTGNLCMLTAGAKLDVLELLCPGRGIRDPSTLSTSRIATVTCSPLGWAMSSSSARVTSHTSPCPKARVLSSPSLRRETRGLGASRVFCFNC